MERSACGTAVFATLGIAEFTLALRATHARLGSTLCRRFAGKLAPKFVEPGYMLQQRIFVLPAYLALSTALLTAAALAFRPAFTHAYAIGGAYMAAVAVAVFAYSMRAGIISGRISTIKLGEEVDVVSLSVLLAVHAILLISSQESPIASYVLPFYI